MSLHRWAAAGASTLVLLTATACIGPQSEPIGTSTAIPEQTGDAAQSQLLTDGVADGRVTENRRGMKFAVRRKWRAPDDTYADIFLIRYADASGAESFYKSRSGDAADYDSDGTTWVTGIPNSEIFTKKELNSYGEARSKAFALAGDTVISIFAYAPAHPDPDGVVRDQRRVDPPLYRQRPADPPRKRRAGVEDMPRIHD